jgi:phospholipase/carboxylesterase
MMALGVRWADRLPQACFLAPNAPFPFDMGPTGYQWFSSQNRSFESDIAGLETAANTVNQFLDDALAKLELDDSNLALVGFSQGGMVALHVGLRRARTPAGVVCMSGMLVQPNSLPEGLVAPPVLLTHGDADNVVLAHHLIDAEVALEQRGVAVYSLMRPGLDHGFDDVIIDTVGAFLETCLA